MITSKQRAYLRGLSNSMETIGQIGKSGIGESVVAQVNEALMARELVKFRVLETAMLTAREAAVELAEKTGADIVQIIGTRFVLYRRNEKNPVISLDE